MPSNSDVYEVNFDGLIGPTHNFSGLSYGNLASLASRHQTSSPKQAALQGLHKMKLLHSLGIKQGFIPPQERPLIEGLREQGFSGTDKEILDNAWNSNQEIFLSCCSASSMWCANAATTAPSCDTHDGQVHCSVANLMTHPHRANEAKQTTQFLKTILSGDAFVIHDPLSGTNMRDEGAANHMRFASHHSSRGVHVFVYGEDRPGQKFPLRQSLEASVEIVQQHQLDEEFVVYAAQNPEAIERGVFHNDVIATSNENVFLVHEEAYCDQYEIISKIKTAYKILTKEELIIIEIAEKQMSIYEAVQSYLFNSQIITLPNKEMAIIAPVESSEGKPRAIIDRIIELDNPITHAIFVDLKQSMANGGGPACLRLRMVVTPEELNQIHPGFLLNDHKFDLIEQWIHTHYRDKLTIEELNSVELLEESRNALNVLTGLLELGKIYSFQSPKLS